MREKQTKYVMSMGLAFNEDNEMKMLSRRAQEGWLFYSYGNLGYKFRKGEPQELIYSVDTYDLKKNEADQYFALFADAGWTHVCSVGNAIHFFRAAPGTKPIYSDRPTLDEKYIKMRKDINRAVIFLGSIALGGPVVYYFLKNMLHSEIILLAILLISGGAFGLSVVLTVASMFLKKRISA